MIQLEDRIRAFATVGKILQKLEAEEKEALYWRAKAENSWFTEANIALALEGIQRYLDEDKLKAWTRDLPPQPEKVRKVGVVMAGNIPLVGFHDFLTVLINGHKLLAKLSSQDAYLIKFIAGILTDIEPWFKEQLEFRDRLNDAEAMIATGSDNSSRYFEYYFAKMPHIIRHNRSSVGILNGQEKKEDYQALGEDIFQYYGLGCRNVSKLYVPEDFNFSPLLDAWEAYTHITHHHKYSNNYDYNKSIYLVNKEPHFDTGFVLMRESEQLVSPVAVVYYEKYRDTADLQQKLQRVEHKIQCMVSQQGWLEQSLPFGKAQQPELWDYADNINTLEFLKKLDDPPA